MLITLLTDFGWADSYVAQMKGVILSYAPQCRIVDATHDIPPQDIWAGAWALSEYASLFPAGTIHVAIVDPGVGTDRRIIAAEFDSRLVVLPDNGLMSGLLAGGRPQRAYAVQNRKYWRSEISSTFHGRDIMAPVAAHLALGADLSEMGDPVEDFVRLELPLAQVGPDETLAHVRTIDRFGNVVTNLDASWLHERQRKRISEIVIRCPSAEQWHPAAIVKSYAEAHPGKLVALVGSGGLVEFSLVNGSAAKFLGLNQYFLGINHEFSPILHLK